MDGVTLNEDLSSRNTGKTKDGGDKKTMFPGLLSSLSGSCHSVTTKSLLKKEESKVKKKVYNSIHNIIYIQGSSSLSGDSDKSTESATEVLETPVSLSPASSDGNCVNLDKIAVCYMIQSEHSDLTPQGQGGTPLLKNGKPAEIYLMCQDESVIPEEYIFVRWW